MAITPFLAVKVLGVDKKFLFCGASLPLSANFFAEVHLSFFTLEMTKIITLFAVDALR